MKDRSLTVFGLAFLGVVAAGAGQVQAGVQVLSQDGFVRARVTPGRGEPVATDEELAPSSGSFDIAAQAVVDIDGFTADARSGMDVSLGQAGITIDGILAYEAADTRPDDPESGIATVNLNSEFHVTFVLDEAYNYDYRRTRTRNDTYLSNDLERVVDFSPAWR